MTRSTQAFTIDRNDSALLAWDHSPAVADPPVARVPLIVESTVATSAPQPVTVGIPFPRGVLTDHQNLSLSDPSGHHVPLQTSPLAHWPDRSVKWLLLDFIAGPLVEGRSNWYLEPHPCVPQERPRPEGSLRVEETGHTIVVDTGPARFMLDRAILGPILQAEIGGESLLDATHTTTALVDARGRTRLGRIERSEIEARGPVRATVRLEGVFEGRRRDRCNFRARVSFFTGAPLVRIELTIHNPRRARHRGGLWDLGDPGSAFFRDLSLHLALAGSDPQEIRWIEDVAGPLQTTRAKVFEVYQDSSGGANWRSRNHVNCLGEVPCQFRGYRVRQGGGSSVGLHASPVVSIRGRTGAVTGAISEFWQQFPKAVDTEGGTLNFRLFPAQFSDLFELQGGEQKTHTIWLHFSRGDRSETDSLKWIHRPARVHCTPEWYAESKCIPYLLPASADPSDRFESYVLAIIEGPNSFFARREIIDEYGWRNYGEVYADHESAYFQGEPPVISHYNNQYDLVLGSIIQYLRSGDVRWIELLDPLARHVADIDIYHTSADKAAYNGGLFWHTDHYRDAATSTHRAYSRANCGPVQRAYGGGPSGEHNYTTGLLHYYYLTGDPQARDAVLSLADWVVAMDDGRKTVFGLVDDGPTGLASCTAQADYHGPGRGCGNSINALLDGWLLTGSRDYLDKAEGLIRRAVHPETDIAVLGLLDTELRWSYTVFLSVLSRYLGLKAEAGELDAMYAYARSCLLAFAAWMLDNEIPYFDRPEKLEYPTETWAAQEFRKANVLRLAAHHAGEPTRTRLIDRGGELAERAWGDLLRFKSRDVARSVALLMVEGVRDSYWHQYPVGRMPAPIGEFDLGSPREFIPQKRRVINQLKTPRGTLKAIGQLASMRNWRWFLSRRVDDNL
jgi:hypothetical protein